MKISLIYDRQFSADPAYWKQGGVWSAYQATKLALDTVGLDVTDKLPLGPDVIIVWDCLEPVAKIVLQHSRVKKVVKLGGYFRGDPDLGIPWKLLGKADVVVVSSPDMVADAEARCAAPICWLPDGYDPRIFYPADGLGEAFVACCGTDDYRGYGRITKSGLPLQIAGPDGKGELTYGIYRGLLPHECMGDFFRQGQLFLSLIGPSKGFTISRLEAMACGLPMICSDQGWLYLCEGTAKVASLEQLDGDPAFLSKTVASLTMPDLRRMREAALAKAAEFTPEKVGRLWLDLLGGMI